MVWLLITRHLNVPHNVGLQESKAVVPVFHGRMNGTVSFGFQFGSKVIHYKSTNQKKNVLPIITDREG